MSCARTLVAAGFLYAGTPMQQWNQVCTLQGHFIAENSFVEIFLLLV